LFAALTRLTSAPGRSAVVAGVFAVHPLQVESVAWASERKDVLCGLFWMATLWAHARYAERPSPLRGVGVFVGLLLALASKPMAVTLPFVLLLLDVWPLGRIRVRPDTPGLLAWSDVGPRLLEKLPLFALSLGATLLTVAAQRAEGALDAAQSIPLSLRIENALVSTVVYVEKAVWPTGLGVFYPYPESFPAWQPVLAGTVLLAVSTTAIVLLRRHRPLFVGWFWFLATLVPAIGLVQTGLHARADRFTYIPLVGLSIAAVWGISELATAARLGRWTRSLLAAAALAWLAALGAAAARQVGYWQDGVALFEHTVAVTGDNPTARGNLGLSLLEQGRVDEGVEALATAFGLPETGDQARLTIFQTLHAAGRDQQQRGQLITAIGFYRAALAIVPDVAVVRLRLGSALLEQGRTAEALREIQAARRSRPSRGRRPRHPGRRRTGHPPPDPGGAALPRSDRTWRESGLNSRSPSAHRFFIGLGPQRSPSRA
jgi:tetratricopeptide (TPR) repeat protein